MQCPELHGGMQDDPPGSETARLSASESTVAAPGGACTVHSKPQSVPLSRPGLH